MKTEHSEGKKGSLKIFTLINEYPFGIQINIFYLVHELG
jgi:hypothetical protein